MTAKGKAKRCKVCTRSMRRFYIQKGHKWKAMGWICKHCLDVFKNHRHRKPDDLETGRITKIEMFRV